MDRNYYADKDCDWVRVALRKESVDRNGLLPLMYPLKYWVALRKESVDRNQAEISESRYTQSRSPQGERG